MKTKTYFEYTWYLLTFVQVAYKSPRVFLVFVVFVYSCLSSLIGTFILYHTIMHDTRIVLLPTHTRP